MSRLLLVLSHIPWSTLLRGITVVSTVTLIFAVFECNQRGKELEFRKAEITERKKEFDLKEREFEQQLELRKHELALRIQELRLTERMLEQALVDGSLKQAHQRLQSLQEKMELGLELEWQIGRERAYWIGPNVSWIRMFANAAANCYREAIELSNNVRFAQTDFHETLEQIKKKIECVHNMINTACPPEADVRCLGLGIPSPEVQQELQRQQREYGLGRQSN